MTEPLPAFSIVIPAYNRADQIMPTLDSVLKQTLQDFECIIVDDGSSDSEKLKQIVEELHDERFRYIHQKNAGGGAARNTGILASRGRYVAFLDSDDLFLSEKLEKCLRKLSGDPLKALYHFIYVDRGVEKKWVRPNRAIRPDENMGEYLFVDNQFIQTSTIVMPRDTAATVLFDPKLRKLQDLDFCVRLHQQGVRFDVIEEPLAVWVDKTEAGRTSRIGGYETPVAWLEKSHNLLTPRAVAGYRATVLFYFLAREKPLRALLDLWNGFRAGVPLRVVARQLLRGFLPGNFYRSLVDGFVAIKGTSGN